MTSQSLQRWLKSRSAALDEIEGAHAAIGGSSRGRRYATQQVNHAYAVLLSSQFQGFCRDLHSEAVDHLVNNVTPAAVQAVLRARMTDGRLLDKGNPNPSNLGADFGRLGMMFWAELDRCDRRNARRRAHLEKLNAWRNAVAHQDFDPRKIGPRLTLRLQDVQAWRSVCNGLACSFDKAVGRHLTGLVGKSPW